MAKTKFLGRIIFPTNPASVEFLLPNPKHLLIVGYAKGEVYPYLVKSFKDEDELKKAQQNIGSFSGCNGQCTSEEWLADYEFQWI